MFRVLLSYSLKFSLLIALSALLVSGCASTKHEIPPAQTQVRSPDAQTAPHHSETQILPGPVQETLAPPLPIQVLGGVTRPGGIPFREGANLSFYLSEAGAGTSDSAPAKIQIIRGEPGKRHSQEFEMGAHPVPPLKSGDIVIVHPTKRPLFEKTIAMAASAIVITLLILVV